MSALQTLRQTRALARCLLAWFVLSMGLAVAAPILQAQPMQLVCSAAGDMRLQVGNGDESSPSASHTLDCVLCFVASAPPPATVALDALGYPQPVDVPGLAATHIAWRTAAPLAARGPPQS